MSSTYVDGVTPLDAAHMNALQQKVEKAAANGYASLDSGGKVPLAQLPPVGADLIYDGDFAAGPTYKDGEIVVYQDASGNKVAYMCTSPTTNAPTPWPGGPPATPAYPRPTYGTTLPASPVDGQEHILVDSTTNPTYQWHFRYNASSSYTDKWEFIGGTPMEVLVGPSESTTTVTTWVNLATIGPRLTVPRSGTYRIWIDATAQHTVVSGCYIGAGIGDWTTNLIQIGGTSPGSSNVMTLFFERIGTAGLVAGQELRMKYYMSVAGTYSVSGRSLRITPLRVS